MQDTTTQNQTQEAKIIERENNFRALENKYNQLLEKERLEKEDLKKQLQQRQQIQQDDDDDDSEPYVDKKRLNKELNKTSQSVLQQAQGDIQKAVQTAIQEERKQMWLKQNNDFFDVLNKYADKFAEKDPELAETILQMPDGFERQKLVYKNIKALGLHEEKPKEPTIQEKIDANRRSPFYQPHSVGAAPYATQGDFSPSGKKNAYEQMQQLKNRLRI